MCVLSSSAVVVDSRWLEKLGLWSYGLYLWHFPISAYLTNETPDVAPIVVFLITFTTATAVAAFTFRTFENPVRHIQVPNAATFAGTGVVIASLWIILGLLATPAPPAVYAKEVAAPAVATTEPAPTTPEDRVPTGDIQRVTGWMPLADTAVVACGLADATASCTDLEGTPKVMLVGDSFASRIYHAIRPLAEENGWGLSAFVRPGCPWMDDVYNDIKNQISKECVRDKHLQDEVIANVEPDVIIVHSYPYRAANKHLTRISTGEVLSQRQVAAAANRTIDRFEAAGATVVVVEPTPFAADGSNVDDCLKLSTWADQCDFEPVDVDSPIDRALRDRADEDPDVWFTGINDRICREDRCSSVSGDLAVMADETHVSGGLWVQLRDVILEPIQRAIDAS